MAKYYLSVFKNDVLDARSSLAYNQNGLFFVKACSDPELALQTINHGCSIFDSEDPEKFTQTLPTAACGHWKVSGRLAFDRIKDARRAAHFIESCSRKAKVVADVKREMSTIYSKRFRDHRINALLSNNTNRIRYMPLAGNFEVIIIALFWAHGNGFKLN